MIKPQEFDLFIDMKKKIGSNVGVNITTMPCEGWHLLCVHVAKNCTCYITLVTIFPSQH